MRPDLFKAVVAQVPFVDVMNTMLDASLPLTTSEYIEWGNPNEKAGVRLHDEVLAVRQRQGADLPGDAGAGLGQRQPGAVLGRARSSSARLRATKTDHNPLLLKANLGAGHGGASGRYDALRETAFTYAFMLWQMGLLPQGSGSSAGR